MKNAKANQSTAGEDGGDGNDDDDDDDESKERMEEREKLRRKLLGYEPDPKYKWHGGRVLRFVREKE